MPSNVLFIAEGNGLESSWILFISMLNATWIIKKTHWHWMLRQHKLMTASCHSFGFFLPLLTKIIIISIISGCNCGSDLRMTMLIFFIKKHAYRMRERLDKTIFLHNWGGGGLWRTILLYFYFNFLSRPKLQRSTQHFVSSRLYWFNRLKSCWPSQGCLELCDETPPTWRLLSFHQHMSSVLWQACPKWCWIAPSDLLKTYRSAKHQDEHLNRTKKVLVSTPLRMKRWKTILLAKLKGCQPLFQRLD